MQKWLSEARLTIKEYLTQLYKWDREYAPRNPQEQLHPLFVESLQRIDYIEYLQDVLTRGSEEDKRDLYENGKAEIEKICIQLYAEYVAAKILDRAEEERKSA